MVFYNGGIDSPGRVARVKIRATAAGGRVLGKGQGGRLRVGRLLLLLPVRPVLRKSEGAAAFGATFGGPRRSRLDQCKARSNSLGS